MKPEAWKDFAREAEAMAQDARAEFGALTAEQLNWKPAPDRWSVAQCLEHLIVTDSSYWPTFGRIREGRYRTPLLRRLPLLSRMWGALILSAVRPEAARRYRTSRKMEPTMGDLGSDIVDRFVAHQHELVEHIRGLEARDAGDVIIGSPVGPLASYDVEMALRIILAHARRHLLQARRVTEMTAFPIATGTGGS